jgi:hypothetical protein
VKLFVAQESVMTKVNQHSPVHQLAILSIGWAAFFHLALDPALINIVPQSTFFGYWPSTLFWTIFFQP